MKRKIYTNTPSENASNPLPEPHQVILQSLMEEEFAAELSLLSHQQLSPRPEAIEQLLHTINRKTLEGHC